MSHHSIHLSPTPANPYNPFRKEEIEQSIPSRFEEQVAKYPDHPAVIHKDNSLSYRELNGQANRIAHRIIAHCGTESSPVGILIGQGPTLIAAIIGILKSGKFYVPLDPAHPEGRNLFALRNAGATLVLTDKQNHTTALGMDGDVVNLDELDASLPFENPSLHISPDAGAYIFYTSGSTGKPKGVFDSHRNVLHNIMRYTNNLHFSADDRLTLLQSSTFSGTVSSLFGALLNGGAICPYDLLKDGLGSSLARWINDMRITVYHSVPAIFRSFLREECMFPTVRLIRLEGDAASRLDVELYRRYFEPGCLLVNGLGATETGISRQFFMNKETLLDGGIVPIGFATEDMTAVLVSDNGDEVEPNRIGELVVRSRYLATGYWNDPILTEKSFRPHPSGEREYRTGDMCRTRSDGCLEYLGRKDFGLKISGNRVEPAEVETALLTLDGIASAIATTREDSPGKPRLVAYIVPTSQTGVNIRFIRSQLKRSLPDYMIPTRYVVLDVLPLNDNGKVDRLRLPAPHEAHARRQTEYGPPRTDIERLLAGLWEDALEVQPVGIHDDFFDLGGDSLAAAEMFANLDHTIKKIIPLSTILQAPTIAQLSRLIEQPEETNASILVPLQPKGSSPPVFFVHGHKGNVIGFRELAQTLGADQPFYGLQSPVLVSSLSVPLRLEKMAAMFIHEIKAMQPTGPYHLGGFCFGGVVAFEMAQQLTSRGDAVGLVALLDNLPTDFEHLANADACRKIRQRRTEQRVRLHSKALKKINLFLKLVYIGEKVLRRLSFGVWVIVARLYETSGKRLPEFMRDVEKVNKAAGKTYRPRTYRGRVAIVLPQEESNQYSDNPRDDWGNVAAAYDICFVPGTEGAMFDKPNVRTLGKNILTLIHKCTHSTESARAS